MVAVVVQGWYDRPDAIMQQMCRDCKDCNIYAFVHMR